MARLNTMRPNTIETMARISLLFLLFAALLERPLSAQTGAKQTPKAPEFPLHSIAVEGNKILSAASIVRASGLQMGEKSDKTAFDAAQAQLLATGYFESVGYRYKPSLDGMGYDATFEVIEIAPLMPLRIEALSEKQDTIVAWLKQTDPLFTGKLPGTQLVLERTAREIEQFLASKNHPEKVLAKVVTLAPEKFEIQIQPARGLAPVAEVTFEGNKALGTTALANAIADVAFGQPYTESGFRQLLENQIRPRYEAKGYLEVRFPKVTTLPSPRVKGVDVKVTVEEGSQYKLTRVAVAGKMASDSARILKAAKLPKLTIADFDEIRQGADRVKDEMKHRGFLDAEVTTQRKLDEAAKSVEVWIVVETGPEFTFGNLTVLGLGLDGEAAIRKMWGLKNGDAFPVEYPTYFLGKVNEEGIFDNLGETTATPKRDDAKHVVDVTLDFKTAPPKPKKPRRPGAMESSGPPE